MKVPLAGSEPRTVGGARDLGPANPNLEAEATIILCSQMSDRERERESLATSTQPVSERKYLTREELANLRGAKREDIEQVEKFARDCGLTVTQVDPASRTVKVRGPLANLQAAFGVELRNFDKNGTKFRSHKGPISLPEAIASAVQAVLGLDDYPIARR
jgi:kumamolisin